MGSLHMQAACKPRAGSRGQVTRKTCRAGTEDDVYETTAGRDPIAAVARSVDDPRGGLLTAADMVELHRRRTKLAALAVIAASTQPTT